MYHLIMICSDVLNALICFLKSEVTCFEDKNIFRLFKKIKLNMGHIFMLLKVF